MKLQDNISVIMRIKNEEYWISYILESILATRLPLYLADTGSTDSTMDIVRSYACDRMSIYDFADVPVEMYGKIWEFLGLETKTPYVIAIGDEIIFREGWERILNFDMGDFQGARFDVQNIYGKAGLLYLSSRWTKRKVWRRDVEWVRTILQENMVGVEDNSKWTWIPGGDMGFHMRYCQRSSRDGDAYGRRRKYLCHGEPVQGEYIDFFERNGPPKFSNPYWRAQTRSRLNIIWDKAMKDPSHREWLEEWIRGQDGVS